MTNIRQKYNKEVISKMKADFGFKNDFEVPKISKVVVNIGIGKFLKDSNQVKEIVDSITLITGQKPVMTKSKKSIAGFKTREGLEVGAAVSLRGRRMWDFLEILVGAAIPRIRDFQGIKETSVDESGNLNIGIKEHLIFPQIMPEQVKNIFSFQVNIVTDAKNKEKGMALFRLLGFPIENKEIIN
ncbi:MAG TPA: 50S ribosomal protein L5 [Candidatus Moranbacteria bacterium]|nr:50S ribosomal protein L5 [Candidatus Moranbacteria bacterium]